jgi:hypothetical protein
MGAKFGEESSSVVKGSRVLPAPRWCPPGLTKTQRQHVQKLRAQEIREWQLETESDQRFNQVRPMTTSTKTWKEKRIEMEEWGSDSSSGDERDNMGDTWILDVNMVFQLPPEFGLPEPIAAWLVLGAERVIFEKPNKLGEHMKPLYIKGHLDGEPINKMLVDGGACVNIMPYAVFENLGCKDEELMRTNMTLSGFSSEASEAKGILSKELTVGSKTISMAFFMVNVKGWYNVLLGHDWIHANGCVPSTLHQCVVQWVGDAVEVIRADDSAYVAMAEAMEDLQDGEVKCLIGRDLQDYDYVSMGKEGFVPVIVRPTNVNCLENIGLNDGQ